MTQKHICWGRGMVALMLLVAVGCAESCFERGCHTGSSIDVRIVSTSALSVEVCREADCQTLQNPRSPTECHNSTKNDWSVELCGTPTGMELEISIPANEQPSPEEQSLTLSAGSTVEFSARWTAEFREFRPNGENCSGICWEFRQTLERE